MLLHKHGDAVEDKIDGVRPGPFSDQGPTNNPEDEGSLPYLHIQGLAERSIQYRIRCKEHTFWTIQPMPSHFM